MSAKQVTATGPERILSPEEEMALAREYYTSRTPVRELASKYGYKTRKSVYDVLSRISREEALGGAA